MAVSSPRGAYSDTFSYEPTTESERIAAASLAFGLAVVLVALLPFDRLAAPALSGFLAAAEAVSLLAGAFTAWMLGSLFRLRPQATLGLLSIAYAVFGALQVGYLLDLSEAPSSALGVASLVAFEMCVAGFVFVEGGAQRARWHTAVVRRAAAVAALYVAIALSLAVGAQRFSHGVTSDDVISPLFTHVVAGALCAGALVLAGVVFVRFGTSRRIHVWLCVVLLTFAAEIFAEGILANPRFSVGWYAAYALKMFGALLFFCVMQAQLASILRRSALNAERAFALQEIALVGTEFGADRDRELLERTARDLGFDWAGLARIERNWITLEGSVGDAAYPERFRARAGDGWWRQALELRDVAIHENGENLPWIEPGESIIDGWSTLVTVPIFLDDRLYGLIAFANTMRRREAFSESDRGFLRLTAKVLSSMIERRRHRRELDHLAYNDALTGLPNRVMLLDVLNKEMAASQRYGRQFAVHFLDLDGFKAVNDAVGHLAGDEVLREAARRFSACVRAADTVARIGGDEFVVLQPNVRERAETTRLTERLRKAFATPIVCAHGEFAVGVSIGTSHYPQDGNDVESLLDRADAELYRRKAARKRRLPPSRHAESSLP